MVKLDAIWGKKSRDRRALSIRMKTRLASALIYLSHSSLAFCSFRLNIRMLGLYSCQIESANQTYKA